MPNSAVFLGLFVLFGSIYRCRTTECPSNSNCQCLRNYISCKYSVSLPDVLDSRIAPLLHHPPVVADLRSNALTQEVLTRFLLVFSSLKRVILTNQLESLCHYITEVQATFPSISLETDCKVSFFLIIVLNLFFFFLRKIL